MPTPLALEKKANGGWEVSFIYMQKNMKKGGKGIYRDIDVRARIQKIPPIPLACVTRVVSAVRGVGINV